MVSYKHGHEIAMRIKIESLEIAGFKSIAKERPLHLTLGDVNILLGPNGAGKSNIISFFRMLNFMMSGTLQNFIATNGTNQAFLHFGAKVTPSINATIRLRGSKDIDVYSFMLTPAAGGRLILNKEEIAWQRQGENKPIKKELVSNFLESGLVNSNDKTGVVLRTILSRCKAFRFHDSSMGGPLRQASLAVGAQYLQSEGNNLGAFLYFLKNNYEQAYRRIVSYVKMVMPQFGDFYLEPVNNYVSLNWTDSSANDYVFTSDQFSDGTIRFIALATLLLQPAKTMPSVIIVDEPELGLHPFAIDQLAEMIKDASLHSQVIIATQSPMLIDSFEPGDITVIDQDRNTNSTVAHRLDAEQLKHWLEDYTVSELWVKNVIGGLPL